MTIAEPLDNFTTRKLHTPEFALGTRSIQPLHIALLGYRSHPHVGGQGIYLHYLSKALTTLGHTVHVYSGPPYPELSPNVTLIKVPSLDLYAVDDPLRALTLKHLRSFTDCYEWWSKISGSFAEPYTFGRRVLKQLTSQDYDIVHDNQSLSWGIAKIARKHNLVATIHHPIHKDREIAIAAANSPGMKWLTKRWYNFITMQEKVVHKLDNIITVSQASYHDIQQCFKLTEDKLTVIPNGIDTEIFKPLPEITRSPLKLITTTSSDQPLKGLTTLLEALAQVKKHHANIRLLIIGRINNGGTAQSAINRLALESNIEFKSGIETNDLVRAYATSCIAICPSLYEGFGLPMGEAMACGLPVISSNRGALPEVVGNAGLLFEGGDSRDLGNKIIQLISDKALQETLRLKARKHIVDNFSWQKVALEMTKYYYQVMEKQ